VRHWGGVPSVALAVLFAILQSVPASSYLHKFDTDPQSGISMEFIMPFDTIAPNGGAPVRVRIENRGASEARWIFDFQSPGDGYNPDRAQIVHSRFAARVGAGSLREFEFLVPLRTAADAHYHHSGLGLNVEGPGLRSNEHTFPSSSRGGGRRLGNIGFSEKLIGAQDLALTNALKAKSIDKTYAVGDPALLPDDWRGLSAYDQLWITSSEWDALSAGLRLAIEQWTATGGILYKCAPGAAEAEVKAGLGSVRTFPQQADESLDLKKLMERMDKPGRPAFMESLSAYAGSWPDKTWIPPYSANTPLLILVIFAFGLIVGPINIFVLAGKEKRARIFWLTPLISVAGTVVIGLTIFIQDGFGGWGHRLALVAIQPDRHTEVIVQEQASKTGVLPASVFRLDPDAMVRQLPTGRRSAKCSVDGVEYSGDWFQSRSVQGQLITAVRPTRSAIRLLNAGEVAAGSPPRILSQIGGQLERIYFLAGDGKVYRADDVGPGREATMKPDTLKDAMTVLRNDFFRNAGPRMHALTGFPKLETGWFYGLALKARSSMVPTLGSIRWTSDDRALFLCPATLNP